ncbi:hypothetical protein P9112_009577 [Eukaryota sp. TZLM1-RC]
MYTFKRLLATFAVGLGHASIFNTIIAIYVPASIKTLFNNSATALGVITGIGSLWQILGIVLALISDRVQFKLGRRRPFISFGALLTLIALALFILNEQLDNLLTQRILFLTGYYLAMIGLSIIQMLTSTLLVDLISKEQQGTGSGIVSLYQVLGSVLGFGMVALELETTYLLIVFIGAMSVCALLTLTSAKEKQYKRADDESLNIITIVKDLRFKPSNHRNFVLVSICRFLTFAGLGIQMFFIFWLSDVLLLPNPETSMSYVALVMLACGVLFAIPIGKICDKASKKKLMMFGHCSLIVFIIGMIFVNSFWQVFITGVFLSLGQISYGASELAFTCSVLPNPTKSGSYLALFGLLIMAGMSFGSLCFGSVLDFFETEMSTPEARSYSHFGYIVIFCLALMFWLCAFIVATRITIPSKQEERTMKEIDEDLI